MHPITPRGRRYWKMSEPEENDTTPAELPWIHGPFRGSAPTWVHPYTREGHPLYGKGHASLEEARSLAMGLLADAERVLLEKRLLRQEANKETNAALLKAQTAQKVEEEALKVVRRHQEHIAYVIGLPGHFEKEPK